MVLVLLPTLSSAQNLRVRQESQHPLRHKAKRVRTDTSGWNNVLTDTDINVQIALDSIDALGVGFIAACDETTDDYCFVYSSSVLALWVNQTKQAQWPIVAVFDNLLLEDGFFMLQEDGVSKIRLE